jgi:hypothetical protein
MRLYAQRVVDLDPEEIPDDAIPADEYGPRIAGAVAPVLNKWLPRLSDRLEEELRAALVVGAATGMTMWQLHELKAAQEEGEEEEPAEVE